jgi:hypothetical protein
MGFWYRHKGANVLKNDVLTRSVLLCNSRVMATKKRKVTAARKTSKPVSGFYEEHKQYIVPAAIGGVIAWLFSGDFMLGIQVFVAVWVGCWVGKKLLAK